MRQRINLNYDWYFKEKYEDKDLLIGSKQDFIKVMLPHAQKIMPLNGFDVKDYQFISSYKRILELHKEKDKSYLLKFMGIAQRSIIYINGKKIKENLCGYNEINLDITDYVQEGGNEIFVMVDSNEGYFPPFGNVVDYLGYGGIYRECYLEITGKNYLINPFFYTTDLLTMEPKFHLEVSFKEEKEEKVHLFVMDNKDILLDWTDYLLSGVMKGGNLGKFTLWDLNNPKLYSIHLELLNGDMVEDSIDFSYGFREIMGNKEGFFLNGSKILLRGLDRHQSYPYVGYAMSESLQRRDARLLKFTLGVNALRSSHYMASPYFLDECDKIGLIVYEEFPGWQYIGNEEWKNQAFLNLDSMILRDRNHPSIAFFGVRINESPDDYLFNKDCYKRAKELDQTRIITGTRNFMKGLHFDDCYTYNNFPNNLNKKGIVKKSQVIGKNTPYFVTEYMGHMYPNKSYDNEERRVTASLFHKRVIKKVEEEKGIMGALGWVMNDYNTSKGFGPNDMICYHGVMDMFRNPKTSSFTYSVFRDEPFLECSSMLAPGDYDGSIFKAPVIYTNLDKIEIYEENKLILEKTISKNIDDRIFYFTDLIGDSIVKEEHLSRRFENSFKKLFAYILTHGVHNYLGIFFHLNLFHIKKSIKLSEKYFFEIPKKTYLIKGYKDGVLVKEKHLGYGYFDHLELSLSSPYLKPLDTYDVMEISLRVCDNLNNTMHYMSDPVNLSVSTGLEILGPSSTSVIGGYASFYLRNKFPSPSKEKIVISFSRGENIEKEIDVL